MTHIPGISSGAPHGVEHGAASVRTESASASAVFKGDSVTVRQGREADLPPHVVKLLRSDRLSTVALPRRWMENPSGRQSGRLDARFMNVLGAAPAASPVA